MIVFSSLEVTLAIITMECLYSGNGTNKLYSGKCGKFQHEISPRDERSTGIYGIVF